MSTKLAHQTQKAAGIGNGMRTATIVAVASGAVTIAVAGGQFSSGVGVLGSYIPKAGDVVAVFRQDSSWLILGLAQNGPSSVVGVVTITPVANTPTSLAVVFPVPLVGTSFACQVTPNTSVPGSTVLTVSYTGLSATGVTLWIYRTGTTPTQLSYRVEAY